MKNLKKINKIDLLIFILLIFLFSKSLVSAENRIIFKINDYAFTSFDLEKRFEYLDFVGSNQDISQDLVIDDFISANLFFEYYKNLENKENYEKKINEIFEEIYTLNAENNKKYDYEVKNDNIINNLKLDYIRKVILENIFNSSINNLNTSSEEIDLLYNIKIKYINLKNFEFNKLNIKFSNLKNIDFKSMLIFLNENKLDYFLKEKEINDINKINKIIKENILLNNNFFIIENDQKKSLIFIEKSFETLEGIVADLYSVRSEDELVDNYLRCENLKNMSSNQNIINKE